VQIRNQHGRFCLRAHFQLKTTVNNQYLGIDAADAADSANQPQPLDDDADLDVEVYCDEI
jgi:hypothetical protein